MPRRPFPITSWISVQGRPRLCADKGTVGGGGALNKLPPRRVQLASPVPRSASSVTLWVEGAPGDRVQLFISCDHQLSVPAPPELGLRIVGRELVVPFELGPLGDSGRPLRHELALAPLLSVSNASSFYVQGRFHGRDGAVAWGSGCALRLVDDLFPPPGAAVARA